MYKKKKIKIRKISGSLSIHRVLVKCYRWYVGDMSRHGAESLLKQEDKEGCFVVRNSSTKGLYTLSLYTKV